jgi:hypothetical protein
MLPPSSGPVQQLNIIVEIGCVFFEVRTVFYILLLLRDLIYE